MNDVWTEYKKILSNLKFGIKRFIKYQVFTKFLIGIIMFPFLKVAFNFLMKSKGLSYITNGLLTKFILSPQGIISVLLLFIFAILVILFEIGGLIVISHQVITKSEESSSYTIIKYCLRRVKNFIGFNGLIIVLCIVIIFPWVNSGIYSSILSGVKIPGFIKDVIEDNELFSILLKVTTVSFFILSIKWIFTMHSIILKDKTSRKALKESSVLIKNNLFTVVKKLLGVSIINFVIIGSLAIIYLIIMFILIEALGYTNTYINLLTSLLFVVGVTFAGVISFILQPFTILHLTKIYISLNDDEIPYVELGNSSHKFSLVVKIFSNKRILTVLFSLVVVITSVATVLIVEYMEDIKYNVEITAHRGSSKEAPGNTLEAIEAAIRNGADYAEIDVQETKDGEIVLLHDKSLVRTTGLDKNIWEVTLDEVKKLDAGSWFDERYKDVKIPTLEEVIDLSKGKIKLNIEIKQNGHEKNLVPKVVNLIKEKGILNSCVVTSLDYSAL